MFVGTFERQLDPKGRLALPAPYRPRLEPRCYLVYGAEKCISVMTAEQFEEVAKEMMEQVKQGDIPLSQLRAAAASATELGVDAQGRINLDEKARTYADLVTGERVVVAGRFDRVEIWTPGRFEAMTESGTAAIAGSGV